jgi:hypothetical protein
MTTASARRPRALYETSARWENEPIDCFGFQIPAAESLLASDTDFDVLFCVASMTQGVRSSSFQRGPRRKLVAPEVPPRRIAGSIVRRPDSRASCLCIRLSNSNRSFSSPSTIVFKVASLHSIARRTDGSSCRRSRMPHPCPMNSVFLVASHDRMSASYSLSDSRRRSITRL